MQRLQLALGWAAICVGLVLPTVMPELTNITVLTLMGIGLVLAVLDPTTRDVLRHPAAITMTIAGVLLLIALTPTATNPIHIASILVLAPLWFSWALATLFAKLGPRLTFSVVGGLALLGTLGAVGVAAFDVLTLGHTRGGTSVNNPIHLADLALMLGFASLITLYDTGRWRWAGLLGPALALIAVLLSGSRGPLIAFAGMAVVATLYLLFTLWRGRRWVPWLAVAAVLGSLAIAPFVEIQLGGRTFSLSGVVQDITNGGQNDSSTQERMMMLQSAWGAFWASPLYGHGMVDYPIKAAQYAPPENVFPPSQHLHNDIANFAVIGGTLGLGNYLLILLSPIIGAMFATPDRLYGIMLLALMMSGGYFLMGQTNAMFGVLTQTVLYGVLLALLAALGRRPPTKTTA